MQVYNSIREIQEGLQSGNVTCKELVQHYLKQIEEKKELNAFLEIFEEEALEKAEETDRKIASGKAGKLAGAVIGIKDNLCYKDHKVSAASKMLENFESLYTATVVDKMLAEDAIIIGRLNCDEFAMGSSNENSAYGSTVNPIDTSKVPGGSSGGSAVAVKAGLCIASLGSDTGGSIRQPASFCDVVGIKPTYGRVSRHGLIAFASSFDQVGPFANNVEDAAILLEVISGRDEMDSTSSSKEVDSYSDNKWEGKAKIAYFKDYLESEGLDPEIRSYLENLLDKLKGEGHEISAVDFPYMDYVVPAYQVLSTAEASSNLARYDGIHYGFRSENADNLESTYTKTRSEGFGREVKRRIMTGTFVLSHGYYDAYYAKAQKVRRLIKEQTEEVLRNHDFILLPVTPHTAFERGKKVSDPVKMYLEDKFTVQANLSGQPGISLPLGQHSNGLPFGVQLLGADFKEKNLLSFSDYLMKLDN